MTSIPPSAPPLPPMPQAPAPVSAEAVPVQPLPADVAAKLAALKQVTAVVQATARQLAAAQQPNVVTVQTEVGALTLKLPVPVPAGTQLVLSVTPQGQTAPPVLRVVLVDGKSLQALAGAQATAVPARLDAPTIVTPAKPILETSITATVLHSTSGSDAAPLRLPQGASFPVRIVAIEPEGTPTTVVEQPASNSAASVPARPAAAALQPASLPGSPPPGGATPASTTAPVSSTSAAAAMAATPGATAAPLPPATVAAAGRATVPAMPPQPAASATPVQPAAPSAPVQPASAPLPAQFSGVVAANSHAGQPLLQTPLGLVSLATPLPLPASATVVLQVTGPLSPASPAPPATVPAAPWSALGEAITVLRAANPAMAERLVAALPQVGPRLAPGLMVFGAALQADGLKAVVGEGPVQALEKLGKRDLAKKLIGELGDEPAQWRTSGGEWRSATLPLFHGGAIEPVRLYLRKPADGEGDGPGGDGGGEGARFVVDVSLSRLGRIQLDGLVRRRSKRFDMILRTAEVLPEAMRRDIQELFGKCCDGLGLAGAVAFRAGGEFIEPARQKQSAPQALVI